MEGKRDSVLYTSFQSTEEGKKELYEYSKNKVGDVNAPINRNSLTGLPALRLFFYICGEIIREYPEKKYGVIVMDITQFKAVNEFLGRKEGDRMLAFIGELLLAYTKTRPFTEASHVRADNFCLFTAYEDKQELANIALDIKQKVMDLPFAYRVIISFGICASEDREPTVNYLKDCAALALSEVKGKYYADYKFFTEEMRTRMLREKRIESEVTYAMRNREIVAYIQPKVDMLTGAVVGGEALARWVHPTMGLINPCDFIPVIEQDGMIIQVDQDIWRQIFQFQRRILDERRTPVPISVNVSRMHMHNEKLKETLIGLQKEYDIPVEYVPIELTESAFANDEKGILSQIQELRKYGFLLSMDDFGSGYSSLNMLKTVDIDEVKLDKEFLSDMDNVKGRIVMHHVINMLREIGVSILVEGVESEDQIDFLIENGCRKAQGYYFFKPMMIDDFDRLLLDRQA